MNIFAPETIFGELPLDVQFALERITQLREITKGEVIFQEGEPGLGLHFVQSGLVKIVKMNEEGREHIIHILSKGDLFAEVLLFQKGVYPATAIGAEKSVVGVIANEDLEKEIGKSNELALALIKALSHRLQIAQLKIRSLALGNSKGRVARTLLVLLKAKGTQESNQGKLMIPYSRQDLANLCGVTRETLARIFSEWTEEKLIQLSEKKLTFYDLDRLETIAEK